MFDPQTGRNFDPAAAQDNSIVEFFTEPAQNNAKSDVAGHPVYDEVEKIRIVQPGNKNTEVVERVKDIHRQRWPQQYAQFRAGLEQVADGYPIEEWPPINRALAMTLRAVQIRTVEQLAAVSDGDLGALGMGGRELRTKAQAYLQSAKDAQPLAEALAAKKVSEENLAVALTQIADLKAAVEKLMQEKING